MSYYVISYIKLCIPDHLLNQVKLNITHVWRTVCAYLQTNKCSNHFVPFFLSIQECSICICISLSSLFSFIAILIFKRTNYRCSISTGVALLVVSMFRDHILYTTPQVHMTKVSTFVWRRYTHPWIWCDYNFLVKVCISYYVFRPCCQLWLFLNI